MSDSWSASRLASESAAKDIQACLNVLSHLWPKGPHEDSASPACPPHAGASPDADSSAAAAIELPGLLDLAARDGWQLPERFGRFLIEDVLGQGGFGLVFKAHDPMLKRTVALKIPRPEHLISADARRRFLLEAEAAAALDHPGIVPVYETGEVPPVPYIVSAYCTGPTLAEWLADHNAPLPPRVAALWMAQLADAVQHAHCRGVLHRDLTPHNVILEPNEQPAPDEPIYRPKLMDFGLAKRIDANDEATRSGMLVGTIKYMSPEQIRGHGEVTVASDVYGLGSVLYELLCRRAPIVGDSEADVLRRIEEEPPPSPRSIRPEVSADLATVCLKCLSKRPLERYASAAELAADLRRYLAGEPVLARPIGKGIRIVRWCRRRPLVAALSGALVATVLFGGVAVVVLWRRAAEHLVVAEANARSAASSEAVARQSLHDAENMLVGLGWAIDESQFWHERSASFRQQLSDELSAHFQELLNRRAVGDAPTPTLATAHAFFARQALDRGDPHAASHHARESVAIWQEIVRLHPDRTPYRRALALAMYTSAVVAAGSEDAAIVGDKLEGPILDLAARLPATRRTMQDYAWVLTQKADALRHVNQYEKAKSVYEVAASIWRQVIAATPDDLLFHCQLGATEHWIGNALEGLGRHEEASEKYAAARHDLEALATKWPGDPEVNRRLTYVCADEGALWRKRMQPATAEPVLRQSCRYGEFVLTSQPHDQVLRGIVASTYRHLALAQRAQDELQDAVDSFGKATAHWEMCRRAGAISDHDLVRLAQAYGRIGELTTRLANHAAAAAAYSNASQIYAETDRHRSPNERRLLARADCEFDAGNAHEKLGDLDAARQCYERAAEILRGDETTSLASTARQRLDEIQTRLQALRNGKKKSGS